MKPYGLIITLVLAGTAAVHGEERQPSPSDAGTAPMARPDPFARLKRIRPKNQLGVLRSVRLDDRRWSRRPVDREQIRVMVRTKPSAAKVYHRRKLLGTTPLQMTVSANSTPVDLVIRHDGFMVLRTRIQRRVTRTYSFTLTPSKFR